MTGIEPRPQRWEARVLPLCHRGPRYTWRKRNPIKQARLDYFLVSSSMTDIINSSSIMPSYRSDHSIIEISINLCEFKHGKGYWKFNNSLLKNQNYLNMINLKNLIVI